MRLDGSVPAGIPIPSQPAKPARTSAPVELLGGNISTHRRRTELPKARACAETFHLARLGFSSLSCRRCRRCRNAGRRQLRAYPRKKIINSSGRESEKAVRNAITNQPNSQLVSSAVLHAPNTTCDLMIVDACRSCGSS